MILKKITKRLFEPLELIKAMIVNKLTKNVTTDKIPYTLKSAHNTTGITVDTQKRPVFTTGKKQNTPKRAENTTGINQFAGVNSLI